jgi:hypothetical protein
MGIERQKFQVQPNQLRLSIKRPLNMEQLIGKCVAHRIKPVLSARTAFSH